VFEHLAVRGVPRLFAFHPANGGYRRQVEAARLRGLGVRPGVPDVVAIPPRPSLCRRAQDRGRPRDPRSTTGYRGHAQICHGLDCALAVHKVE